MLPFIIKIKNDFRAFNRHSIWVVISIAIYSFGSGFFDPYFSVFLSGFASNYSQLGAFVALFTFVSVMLTIPVGFLMDFVHYRTMLAIGKVLSIVVAILYFLAGYTDMVWVLVLALVINGIAFPFNWTGTETVLGAYSRKHKTTQLFGFYSTLVNAAWMTGLLIATFFVVEHFPLYFIFIPLMFFPILSILIFNTKLPGNSHSQSFGEGVEIWLQERKVLGRFYGAIRGFNSQMWCMIAMSFLEKFIQVAVVIFLPVVILRGESSLIQIGLMMGLMHTPSLFSFIFAEIANRGRRLLVIIIGYLIAFISCFVLSYTDSLTGYFTGSIGAILGLVMAGPSVAGIMVKLTPDGHFGTVTAIQTVTRRIGLVIAPMVIGYLADQYSMQTAFLFVSLIAMLMLAVVVILRMIWFRKDRLYLIEHPGGDVPYYL